MHESQQTRAQAEAQLAELSRKEQEIAAELERLRNEEQASLQRITEAQEEVRNAEQASLQRDAEESRDSGLRSEPQSSSLCSASPRPKNR